MQLQQVMHATAAGHAMTCSMLTVNAGFECPHTNVMFLHTFVDFLQSVQGDALPAGP